MGEMDSTLDSLFAEAKSWRQEMLALRRIVLDCPLKEEKRWRWPCYTADGRNIVLIHAFKDYCALLFFKGALMKDPGDLLIRQTENVQSGRQIRFSTLKEIESRRAILKSYILEALAVEKAGLKVAKAPVAETARPGEFEAALTKSPKLKSAFEALTPGRQRAYLLHFAAAKQSKTRTARIETCSPRILAGKGMDD